MPTVVQDVSGDSALQTAIAALKAKIEGAEESGDIAQLISDINTALAGKQNTLTFDSAPTAGSTNPVISGGIKTALNGKQDTLTFDTEPTAESTKPVTSGGVYTKVSGLRSDLSNLLDGKECINFTIDAGYVYNNGIIAGSSAPVYQKHTKDIIPVTPHEVIHVILTYSEIRSMWMRCSLYDSEGNWISNSGGQVSGEYATYHAEFTIPDNVFGIKISFNSYENYEFDMLRSWNLIDDIKSDVSEVQGAITDLNEQIPPHLKTRMNLLTEVSEEGGAQLIDLSQYTLKTSTTYKFYQHVDIPFTVNGKYYMNPLGANADTTTMTARDAEGNTLPIAGTSNSSIGGLSGWDVLERVSDTHIRKISYTYEENFKGNKPRVIQDYIFESPVAVVRCDSIRIINLADSDFVGITFERYSRTYLPYGTNISYNEELVKDIFDEFGSNNYWYDVPEKRLNPWMQRSFALSDNLLDDRKIDWIGSGNYYLMKAGQTVPVIGGQTIVCNKNMYTVKGYDSSGAETTFPNIGAWKPYKLGDDIVSIRFNVWRASGNSVLIPADTYEPVYLYYTDKLYPYDDVDRNPVPMAQINGYDINKNLYDQCIPDVTSSIVRMMKTFAIRELNHQRNAIRVGTFNIFINNTWTNRPIIKEELETYGIDICAFQEARNLDGDNQLNIGDYLKGWQFQYCNTNPGLSGNGRALASRYEVLESTEVAFTANTSNSYLKCVIQLPRYKDYADGLTTLSLYTYHGDVSSASTREAEVTQMLTDIASDASDFVIVTGDTNDFSTNKDIWTMFNNAGLTPVHDGKSETVTDRNNSLDNIFISSNIRCLFYDVINSSEWMYKPTPSSADQPISDHDLVFADLQFDFETVINAKRSS